MARVFVYFWRWSLFAAGALLAPFSTFLYISGIRGVDICDAFKDLSVLSPAPLGGFFASYFLIGFLYYRMMVLLIDPEEDFDSLWERLAPALLIVYWPIGIIGELAAQGVAATSRGVIRRTLDFLFASPFVRLMFIMFGGVWALSAINESLS